MTSKLNEHNIRFPRDEEGNIDVKNGKYDTNNQPKKATFKYEQNGGFCLGVAKIKSKNRTITGKRCLVLIIQGKRWLPLMRTKNKYRKNLQELESLLHHRENGPKREKIDNV